MSRALHAATPAAGSAPLPGEDALGSDVTSLIRRLPKAELHLHLDGSIRPAIDFAMLADLDMEKRIDLDSLISRTYKFDEINEGFRLLTTGAVARGVIEFN